MSRGARVAALGVTVAAFGMLLAQPSPAVAADADTWRVRLHEERRERQQLLEEVEAKHAEIRRTRAAHRRAERRFQHRLAAIYKAGGVVRVEMLLAGRADMHRAAHRADVMQTLATSDARTLERYLKLTERIPQLEEDIDELEEQVEEAEERIAAARAGIREALREAERRRREAAEAREAARRMSRIPEVPLTPRAVAAETVGANVSHSAPAEVPQPMVEPDVAEPEPPQPTGYTEAGIASIYGSSFIGRTTANGEIYDASAMTAAHRTLPFGTWVQVQGPGGSALVRINDRGPFVGGRIIDLSAAAAAAVGVTGIAQVTITVQN